MVRVAAERIFGQDFSRQLLDTQGQQARLRAADQRPGGLCFKLQGKHPRRTQNSGQADDEQRGNQRQAPL